MLIYKIFSDLCPTAFQQVLFLSAAAQAAFEATNRISAVPEAEVPVFEALVCPAAIPGVRRQFHLRAEVLPLVLAVGLLVVVPLEAPSNLHPVLPSVPLLILYPPQGPESV